LDTSILLDKLCAQDWSEDPSLFVTVCSTLVLYDGVTELIFFATESENNLDVDVRLPNECEVVFFIISSVNTVEVGTVVVGSSEVKSTSEVLFEKRDTEAMILLAATVLF
jgi:hypothetical protein